MNKIGEKIKETLKLLLGIFLVLIGVPMALGGGELSEWYKIFSLPFFIIGVIHSFHLVNEDA